MFFVVDVETSGLTPWTGELLSVGVVPVRESGEILPEQDHYYARLTYRGKNLHILDPMQYTDTQKWWSEQPREVRSEAWDKYPRVNPYMFRRELADYVESIEPEKSNRFIAANPVAFDKMWLEAAYDYEYDRLWPFHYRCLCLRSMRFGIEWEETTYGSRSGAQQPTLPHHAYHDAVAEAADLQYLINQKKDYVEKFISGNLDSDPK